MSLKSKLNDWQDWDFSALYLAQSMGLMEETLPFPKNTKHVFWTDDPVGNLLHNMLNQMVNAQILERREEPDIQYRWNPAFKGSWES